MAKLRWYSANGISLAVALLLAYAAFFAHAADSPNSATKFEQHLTNGEFAPALAAALRNYPPRNRQ